jgi:hypothetical protein
MSTLRLPALARASCRDVAHHATLAFLPVAASGLPSAAVLHHALVRSRHTFTVMADALKGR